MKKLYYNNNHEVISFTYDDNNTVITTKNASIQIPLDILVSFANEYKNNKKEHVFPGLI